MGPNLRCFERHTEESKNAEGNSAQGIWVLSKQSVRQHLLIDDVCDETGVEDAVAKSFPGFSQENEACMKYYLSVRNTDMSGFSCYVYDLCLGTNCIWKVEAINEDVKFFFMDGGYFTMHFLNRFFCKCNL